MSLIEIFQNTQSQDPQISARRRKVQQADVGPPKLGRVEQFEDILDAEMQKTIRSDYGTRGLLKKDGTPRVRTRLMDANFPLENLTRSGEHQGCTEKTWRSMIRATVSGFRYTLNNSQGNGEWQVLQYDHQVIAGLDGVERLFLIVQFLDMNDGEDIKYRNGVEAINLEVKSTVSDELVEALAGFKSGDDQQSALMTQLLQMLVDEKKAEATVEATPPKTSRARRAKQTD